MKKSSIKQIAFAFKTQISMISDGSKRSPKPIVKVTVFADIAIKASGAEIGFVDRFSGTLILLGTVSEVSASIDAVLEYAEKTLKFAVCHMTKT